MARTIIVLKGWPRLSETFIAQEIAALEARGHELVLVSLRHPTDDRTHPVHDLVQAPVVYLPEYLHDEPRRVVRAWRRAHRLAGFAAVRDLWWTDLRRDPTRNRIRRLGQAMVLATEVLRPADHVHAHFLHTPTSVARYAARLVGARFSVSAHAKDIWTLPAWEKREKLLDAAWTVTCTRANAEHLNGLLDAPGKVRLAYHGLDLERFPSAPPRPPNDGRSPGAAVSLLTVARAVPKKGLDVLLDALARLPARLFWRFHHIGGGPEVARLRARASRLGLADRICWHGAQTAPSVLAAYRAADLFVLPSRIAGDGDRDGLPNVLMEALSQRLAVLATGVSAIPELIEDGRTGALVPPDDPDVLAAALAALIVDPGRRMALAGAGEDAVRGRFAMRHGIDVIDGLLAGPHAVAAA